MKHSIFIVLLISIFSCSLSVVAQEELLPSNSYTEPCETVGHGQFRFWVGNWNVYDTLGNQVGTNKVQLILRGCVLSENWTSSSFGNGKSYNSYDPEFNSWLQTWVDQWGSTIHFKGHWVETKMIFKAEKEDSTGTLHYLMTFTPLPNGEVVQNWRATRDFETWTSMFYGIYRRKE